MPTTTSTPSWLVNRLPLVLSFFTLLFTACEEPTDIGLNVQPDSQVGVHYMEIPVSNTSTVLLDSIATRGTRTLNQHLVGHIPDPLLGSVTAQTYAELRLRENNFSFGNGAQIDSISLNLHYLGAYGQPDQPMTISVHPLTQNIAGEDSVYYVFSRRTFESNSVGSKTFVPNQVPAYGNKGRKFLHIPLDTLYGKQIMGANMANQTSFREAVKGIALVPGSDSRSIASFGFERDVDSSFVKISYRQGGEAKTAHFYIDLSTRRFHSIRSDRSSTPVAALVKDADTLASTAVVPNRSFIQAGVGLRMLVNFPGLQHLRQQIGSDIAINRAELEIPVESGTTQVYGPPPVITLADADKNNRVKRRGNSDALIGPDNAPTTGVQLIPYNSDQNVYRAQLGAHVQAVIYGRKPNAGIIVYSTSNAVQVNRAVLPLTGMRLKIYYTKIN